MAQIVAFGVNRTPSTALASDSMATEERMIWKVRLTWAEQSPAFSRWA